MPLTVSYSFNKVVPKTQVSTYGGRAGSDSDTIGLSGGGFATSVTDAAGYSDITFYGVDGTIIGSNSGFQSVGGRLSQLANGNVVIVGIASDGGVNFAIENTSGATITSGSISNFRVSNPDVAALTGGGFVVVAQHAFDAPDNDINVFVRDASGNSVSSFSIDTGPDNDENPSVAGLTDGGFVVAYDRAYEGGYSYIHYAVYNADGSTRISPTGGFGSANDVSRKPHVAANSSGGFS